ncbi:MAG TPA: hypothetical protein VG206_03255 [Terriglobia bacterium]|nr:hypothetical protein [Terriglobia bacterium]
MKTESFRLYRRLRLGGLLAGVLILLTCFYVSKAIALRRFALGQTGVTSFVLQTETRSYNRGLNGQLVQRKTVARRSDGSTATLTERTFPTNRTLRSIIFANGDVVTFVDNIAAKTTWPGKFSGEGLTRRMAWITHPAQNCSAPGDTFGAYTTLLGHRVAAVKWPLIQNSQVTTWAAPDLGCEALRGKAEMRQPDGSFRLDSEEVAVFLRMGEPDASLFRGQPNYHEVRPSDLERLEAEKLGVSLPDDTIRHYQTVDQQYSEMRARLTSSH